MVIKPAIWLAGWEHFCPYLRNKVFPKYVICGGTENNINKIIFIEQIQKKLMTKFFIKLKNNFDWFSQFWGKNFFLNKIHHNFIQVSSNMPKFRKNLWSSPEKTPEQKDKQKDGRTILYFIFYRTIPATTESN